jgi:UDP-N-acetylglucosamine:LPS N-acetylglucosamine transferase
MAVKKVLVMTDHMPWGHRSIARAIYGFLKTQEKENNFKVDYVEVKSELGFLNELYTFMYRYIPVTNRLPTWWLRKEKNQKAIKEFTKGDYWGVEKALRKYQPDLVISAYLFHTAAMVTMDKQRKYKLWSIVADPWTVNPVSYSNEVNVHLVYDEVGVREGVKMGIRGDKILPTGWWVRPEMYQTFDRGMIRRRLGFNDDRPVVFVGGGSLGTSSLAALLPALMVVKKPVGVIFNSGTDKLSFNMVEEYAKLLEKVRRDGKVQIKNLGLIENMGEVLTACDIVFGKAGPNFLFDVVARQKPFVSITHIGGQEDGNVEIIKKKKLGWVKEGPGQAVNFFLDYVNDPKKYEEMYRENIRAEAENNKKSMGIILERLKKELE